MTNAEKPLQRQQGDVWIEKIESIPTDAVLRTNEKRLTLAEGEQTGHHHRLVVEMPDMVDVYENSKGEQFFDVKEDCTLVHEEHLPHIIEKGMYKFGQINEYDYTQEETRRAAD